MPKIGERITISAGTMVNRSAHEDDEPEILEEPKDARVVGEPRDHALPVIIPSMEPDVVFYIHQPEGKSDG